METIFDYNITEDEIKECGFFDEWQIIRHGLNFSTPITKSSYLKEVDQKAAYLDLGILMHQRKDTEQRDKFFSNLPLKAEEYLLGFDYKTEPI